MSLRIQNDVVAGGISPEVSRTGEAGSIGSGSTRGRIGSGSADGDQVDISNAAASISAGVSAHNLQQAVRVTQLGALYAAGQYTVDSAKVSRALVDSSVSGSVAGEA